MRIAIVVVAGFVAAGAVVAGGLLWVRQDVASTPPSGQGSAVELPAAVDELTRVPSGSPSPSPAPLVLPEASASASVEVSQEPEPGYDHSGAPEPVDKAVWDTRTRGQARAASEAVMDVYLGDRDPQVWWQNVSVLLTASARRVYDTVPPEALPDAERTGSAEVTGSGSPLVAVATVPTGAGAYEVTLVRLDGSAPWLADKIVPAGP